MLSDHQIHELCARMDIPLTSDGIIFKDEIDARKIRTNHAYFINLDDQLDEDGKANSGTHWTCFYIAEYPNHKLAPLYFDPYGMPPPEKVKEALMARCKQKIPFNTKNIQSLMANACGWYCCAFLHYVICFSHRIGDLYEDTEQFLSYFDDLNKSVDFKKNEYILKYFFRSKDPSLQKEIEVFAPTNEITEDTGGGVDGFHEDGVRVQVQTKLNNSF